MKAIEQAPFILIIGLYLIIIGIGAGIDAPPLASTSLLVVALTLAVFHHLLNVYQVAGIIASYPKWPFVLDLAAAAVLAVMFGLLAHPFLGDFGTLKPPFLGGSEMQRFLGFAAGSQPPNPEVLIQMFRHSLWRFFLFGGLLWCILILWHLVVLIGERAHVRNARPTHLVLSFVSYGAMVVWGLYLTRWRPLDPAESTSMLDDLALLATVSVTAAAALLWYEYAGKAKYVKKDAQ